MKLKNLLCLLICVVTLMTSLSSCEKKDEPQPNEKTLFIYFPWTPSLYSYFITNINGIKKSISENTLHNQKVVVFLSTSNTSAKMYELEKVNNTCQEKVIKEYSNVSYTSESDIASLLNDMKKYAPATKAYSMIIGSHGMGWIPKDYQTRLKGAPFKFYFQYEDLEYPTRFFGGDDNTTYVDITTLADAIKSAGLKMEYIMFDDCYMQNIEVAYDLKNVTHYLIGSTSEIMAYGMPYDLIGKYLLGNPDYNAICQGFVDFYKSYSNPSGTIGVADCEQVDSVAKIMKEINSKFSFNTSLTNSIQDLDGYSPTIFFDFGNYVENLCTDKTLLNKFNSQLSKAIPYKGHTGVYYSSITKVRTTIKTFSGTTCSDLTQNSTYGRAVNQTNWWKATH